MDFINKLLDENYDWGDKRIDEDVYDELSAELIIDYLKKHDSEIRQMLALSWNFDNPKKVIQWIRCISRSTVFLNSKWLLLRICIKYAPGEAM